MRIRHLYMAIALLLPFGLVTAFSDEPPAARSEVASAPTDDSDSDVAWMVTQDERFHIERVAAEAAEAEAARVAELEAAAAAEAQAAAEAAEAAESARQAELARQARQARTTTTVARRSTTTVAPTASRATPRMETATGSLPPKRVSDCESGGDPTAVNPNGHYGKWQFSQSTWESVGGSGRPDQASEAEQDKRASMLWDNGNGSGHWSCY